MDLSGEYRIPTSPQAAWDALNDPEVLKACIPGCRELQRVSDSEFSAVVTSKVGPISATFEAASHSRISTLRAPIRLPARGRVARPVSRR